MAPPIIRKVSLGLRTVGVSTFWLHVDNAVTGNAVTVTQSNGDPGYWEGTLRVHPRNATRAKASVRFNPARPLNSKSRKRKSIVVDDIIDVTITVTNGDGDGTLVGNEVIVDP